MAASEARRHIFGFYLVCDPKYFKRNLLKDWLFFKLDQYLRDRQRQNTLLPKYSLRSELPLYI